MMSETKEMVKTDGRLKDMLGQATDTMNSETNVAKAKTFSNELREMGFNPIAETSLSKLYKLLKIFNVFFFENIDEDGRVSVSDALSINVAKAIALTVFSVLAIAITAGLGALINGINLLALIGVGVSVTIFSIASWNLVGKGKAKIWSYVGALVFTGWQIIPQAWMQSWSGIIVYSIIYVAFATILGGTLFVLTTRTKFFTEHYGYATGLLSSVLPKKTLLRWLFKDNCDKSGNNELKVGIQFDVDEEFEALMRLGRQHGLQPCIASVPQALHINRREIRVGTCDFVRESISDHWWDPILYFKNKEGNIAIAVKRCGNFPDEKALLRRAKQLRFYL